MVLPRTDLYEPLIHTEPHSAAHFEAPPTDHGSSSRGSGSSGDSEPCGSGSSPGSHLICRPCDERGDFLDNYAPPPAPHVRFDTAPFADRPSLDFADTIYNKMQGSVADINDILTAIHARDILLGHDDADPIFESHTHLVTTIDAITVGGVPYKSFSIRWTGPVDNNSPQWKRESYTIHYQDIIENIRAMAGNTELHGHWDNSPKAVFDADGRRVFSDLMTGQWAWDEADKITEDPNTHGAMLCPVMLGADKTTVSVGTGNRAYHLLYSSLGNMHNGVRCAHSDTVSVLAFLPIIKGTREEANNKEFHLFRKQVYHDVIKHILLPLRPYMHIPLPLRCPNGHWCAAIFDIGPFLADYPEQVYVSGIVQGWCPKCLAFPDELDNQGTPRFRALTDHLQDVFDPGTLWDVFGVVRDVEPFTYSFPRADIHDLVTPDLLHQLVKGTFKDHLTKRQALGILDDLDRQLAVVPIFTALRRFPDGRHFSQWTGNDSKALMKVLLPALVGLVPDDVVECVRVFLDFAYLARLSVHTSETVARMEELLQEFCVLRTVFIEAGVRDDVSLPRQHGLFHFPQAIILFGALIRLSTSITESKHIEAVKRPWRASNRSDALPQVLTRLIRVSKLNALRVELGRSGLLEGEITDWALREPEVTFAVKPDLAVELAIPDFVARVRRFLHQQEDGHLGDLEAVPLEDCPWISLETQISLYLCAHATYFAPSELSLPGGMHSEIIRCTPNWMRREPRYDTVLVQVDEEDDVMHGLAVARLCKLFSLNTDYFLHECALVEWFDFVSDAPDELTGMWVVKLLVHGVSKPEMNHNHRSVDIIPLDSIVHSCHLIPYYGTKSLKNWRHYNTLDAFKWYYVNSYIDYHTFQILK
ncbi:uncharacterized protein BXZ73DRAFT_91410 [Epithele typhae]|uniref:uncharacterized protein n=1 Tax=Epithele typhae TaxID=378194 RepID=UPI0020076DB6|nr:uncharacterized protein BXZ73DRAFT_91410 [Epithele typhae]KAH9923725.1 hypothetical protein BXZ73DRAFT_91410 [Epithele typhae]